MQAEGDVVRLPVAQEVPLDFAAFFVPEDQICLLLFEAGSPAAVQRVTERAGLQVTRVLPAMDAPFWNDEARDERNVAAEGIGVGRTVATEEGGG